MCARACSHTQAQKASPEWKTMEEVIELKKTQRQQIKVWVGVWGVGGGGGVGLFKGVELLFSCTDCCA
jgi:hypothetical protein